MRKIIVFSMLTLDGVIQGPGAPEEDTANNFKFGGWVAPFSDDVYNEEVNKELQPAEYLLGRKTFEIWEDYWPKHKEMWPGINTGMKYVFSSKRNETEWENTDFIKSIDEIKELKKMTGHDLHVWGSSELVHLLLAHDLVDEMHLKIHPIVVGKGKKLWSDNSVARTFNLTRHVVTTTGVIIASFLKAGNVEVGRAGPE